MMAKIPFETLYQRRLKKKQTKPHITGDDNLVYVPTDFKDPQPIEGSTRVVSIPCPIYQGWRKANGRFAMLETMIPDLALAIRDDAELDPIYQYIHDFGLACELVSHKFMARYTVPSDVSKWIDERPILVNLCRNVGDQVILKLMFPELR